MNDRYHFVNTRLGINEAARVSGLSVERVTFLYEQARNEGVMCIFKVYPGHPVTDSGLLRPEGTL